MEQQAVVVRDKTDAVFHLGKAKAELRESELTNGEQPRRPREPREKSTEEPSAFGTVSVCRQAHVNENMEEPSWTRS